MERKALNLYIAADAPEGTVIARFATLNVIDADGDVTLPGAFGDQQVRIQPFGHDTRAFMIGKGTIREEGNEAIMRGVINLDSAAGREAYAALKFDMENGRAATEWSYTYDVEDEEAGMFDGRRVRFLKRLKVHSVDPVFLGAGVGTATLAVKGREASWHGVPGLDVQLAELAKARRELGPTADEVAAEKRRLRGLIWPPIIGAD